MVTGGFRTQASMEACILRGGTDAIGIGRPLCGDPDCVGKMLRGEMPVLPKYESTLDLPWGLRWMRYVVVGNLLVAGGQAAFSYHMLLELANRDVDIEAARSKNILWLALEIELVQRRKAAALKGLNTVGFVLNAPQPIVTPGRVAVALIALIVLLHAKRRG